MIRKKMESRLKTQFSVDIVSSRLGTAWGHCRDGLGTLPVMRVRGESHRAVDDVLGGRLSDRLHDRKNEASGTLSGHCLGLAISLLHGCMQPFRYGMWPSR
jgi:hypothetical protein